MSSAYANQRRSQRILLTVPVVISGNRLNKTAFSERTTTLIVNAHGALLQLREEVQVGQGLRIKNSTTGEEIACTVVDANPGNSGLSEVGVEFSEPFPHFWRVSFPPADWTPRSIEARRLAPKSDAGIPTLVKK